MGLNISTLKFASSPGFLKSTSKHVRLRLQNTIPHLMAQVISCLTARAIAKEKTRLFTLTSQSYYTADLLPLTAYTVICRLGSLSNFSNLLVKCHDIETSKMN